MKTCLIGHKPQNIPHSPASALRRYRCSLERSALTYQRPGGRPSIRLPTGHRRLHATAGETLPLNAIPSRQTTLKQRLARRASFAAVADPSR